MTFFEDLKLRIYRKKLRELALYAFPAAILLITTIGLAITEKFWFLAVALLIAIPFIIRYAWSWLSNNHEYKNVLRQAEKIGDIDYVDEMLRKLEDNKYTSDQLRFNETLLFHLYDKTAHIISPKNIKQIETTSRYGSRGGVNYYVNIICEKDPSLMIHVRNKKTGNYLVDQLLALYDNRSNSDDADEEPQHIRSKHDDFADYLKQISL